MRVGFRLLPATFALLVFQGLCFCQLVSQEYTYECEGFFPAAETGRLTVMLRTSRIRVPLQRDSTTVAFLGFSGDTINTLRVHRETGEFSLSLPEVPGPYELVFQNGDIRWSTDLDFPVGAERPGFIACFGNPPPQSPGKGPVSVPRDGYRKALGLIGRDLLDRGPGTEVCVEGLPEAGGIEPQSAFPDPVRFVPDCCPLGETRIRFRMTFQEPELRGDGLIELRILRGAIQPGSDLTMGGWDGVLLDCAEEGCWIHSRIFSMADVLIAGCGSQGQK